MLGTEIHVPTTAQGAAYGAGVLAAVGAKWFPSVEAACEALVKATRIASPGSDSAAYAEAHAIYRDLYPALADSFRRMRPA